LVDNGNKDSAFWLTDVENNLKNLILKEKVNKNMLLFEASNTFAEAGVYTKLLLDLEGVLSESDIIRIVSVTLKNDQILYSFEARKYLKPFFVKHRDFISDEQLEKFLKAG
jgi:hypothetical protein